MNNEIKRLIASSHQGKTIDGKNVFPGKICFYLKDTLGLPLDVQLDVLHENNCVPDWKEFVQSAYKAGWKGRKIYNECVYAVVDSCIFPKEHHAEFKTLIGYLITMEKENGLD